MKLFEKLSKKLDFEHILHFGTWGILMGTYISNSAVSNFTTLDIFLPPTLTPTNNTTPFNFIPAGTAIDSGTFMYLLQVQNPAMLVMTRPTGTFSLTSGMFVQFTVSYPTTFLVQS